MPLPELRTGMPRTANVLSMMASAKMRQNLPSNVLARKRLETFDEDQNWLRKQRTRTEKAQMLQFEQDLLQYEHHCLDLFYKNILLDMIFSLSQLHLELNQLG